MRTIYDFEQFKSLEQHASCIKQLARYNFLLVFYSDARLRWNRCCLISRQSQRSVITKNKEKNNNNATEYPTIRSRLCDAAKKLNVHRTLGMHTSIYASTRASSVPPSHAAASACQGCESAEGSGCQMTPNDRGGGQGYISHPPHLH